MPIPAVGQVFSGFEFLGVILVTAIPFGIYDLVEAMDNVESAEAAGDEYPTTRVLTADGIVSLIGCLMGLGGGSILAGLVLGAIGVFVIERDFHKAAAFALAGAVLTYFGFMHGEAVGFGGGLGVTPGVALAYAVVAAGFFAVEKFSGSTGFVSHPETPLAAPAE